MVLNTWPFMRILNYLFPLSIIVNFVLITSLFEYAASHYAKSEVVIPTEKYPVLLIQKNKNLVQALNLTSAPIVLENVTINPGQIVNHQVVLNHIPNLIEKGTLTWNTKTYSFPADYAKIAPEVLPFEEIPGCQVCQKTLSRWTIPKGIHNISQMIVVPQNLDLIIAPGATLNFTKGAGLFSRSPITAMGTEEMPINFKGTDWNGMTILYSGNKPSTLSHLNVSGATGFDIFGMRFTGSINLINGHHELKKVVIENSLAEDAINLKWVTGSITDLKIVNSFSDALDVDWSKITLNKLFVNKTNNDCLDLSGGVVKAYDLELSSCHDKAISNGEANELRAKNVKISSSKIGIANKDGAVIFLEQTSIKSTRTSFDQYHSKTFYPEPEFNFVDKPDIGNDVGPSSLKAGKTYGDSKTF